MAQIVKANSAVDMLAVLPHLLGYKPRESVVYAAFGNGRSIGALRFDLEAAAAPQAAVDILTQIEGADAVFVAAFTGAESVELLAGSLASFEPVASAAGLRVLNVLAVGRLAVTDVITGDRYPLAEVESSEGAKVAATLPPVAEGAASGTELPEVPEALREQVAQPSTVDVRRYADAGLLVDMLDYVADGQAPGVERVQLIEAALADVSMRDVAMATWARGAEFGERMLEMIEGGEPMSEVELDALVLGSGERPDVERLRAMLPVLGLAAAALPGARAVPSMTVLAWIHWALGSASSATVWLDRCDDADSGYPFARLMRRVLELQMLPRWALRAQGRATTDADTYLN